MVERRGPSCELLATKGFHGIILDLCEGVHKIAGLLRCNYSSYLEVHPLAKAKTAEILSDRARYGCLGRTGRPFQVPSVNKTPSCFPGWRL